jgi:hypothetical protein
MMKQYHNGQRKGMMYGGNTRKPMMYGGKAKKSPRKKMQMGGNAMMSTNQMQQQEQKRNADRMNMMAGATPTQQRMGMAFGGRAKLGDLNKDGKLSGYETARQKAIEKNMKKKKA